MIAASTAASAALMEALRTLLDGGSVSLYSGTRPAPGGTVTTLVATCALPAPCGSVSAGDLSLLASAQGQIVSASAPTWARLFTAGGGWVLDCDVRLSVDADAGQELVITAPALYPGAFVSIASGSLSARP